MKHDVKCKEPYFSDVWAGIKNVEIRFNDRSYKNYDYLVLHLCGENGEFIDKEIITRIIKIRSFNEGLKEGYVLLYLSILGKYDFT